MKRTKSLLSICMFFCLFNLACEKSVTDDFNYGIATDKYLDMVCQSLRLHGKNVQGQVPSGSGGNWNVAIDLPDAVEVSAGVLLFIPYYVADTSSMCSIYITVKGANNYWETPLVLDPTFGQPYFRILIPRFVQDGNFDLLFTFQKCDGTLSPIYSTQTKVSPLADCNTFITGEVGITVRGFFLGDKEGTAGFAYDMYNIPDRMDVRYNGEWVASTGNLFTNSVLLPNCNNPNNGFVPGAGELSFQYDPDKSRYVELYISGCNSGTKWDAFPICPQ